MNQFNCKQINLDNMFCEKILIKNRCVFNCYSLCFQI